MKQRRAAAAWAGTLAALALTTSNAIAFPAARPTQSTADNLIEIRGGCGLGWHRGPWGGCRPNPVRYVYAPGVYHCWWRATPWGPRRVCAW
jgi:hypothetical protein